MSVLNFATSPNSGVKFLGGVSEVGKDDFSLFFLLVVRRFLSFVLFFCYDRATHHCLP